MSDKYSVHLNKIKTFDFENSSEKDVSSLIDETETLNKDLSLDKQKLELKIDDIQKSLKEEELKLKEVFPDISNSSISDIEISIKYKISELISSLE